MPESIVLAYSGGLDTSVAVKWLAEQHDAQIICLLVDVGQGVDVDTVVRRAGKAGAADVVVIDAKAEFAEHYCLPALQAGALYQNQYPLISSLSRPLIAEKLVQVARERGAFGVAHGCTGKGNDQVRFEAAVAALAPDLQVFAPVRDWGMTREAEIAYAAEHGIEVPVKSGAAYSIDANLWGRSIECGPLEDPWTAPEEEPFLLTHDPVTAPDAPQEIVIGFEEGTPVSLDGQELPLHELVLAIGAVAGAHGVGRIDMIEDRLVGIKSREVYEAPAAMALYAAQQALESLVLERDLRAVKAELSLKYATLVYNGLWFSPLRAALDAFVRSSKSALTGEVRLRLFKGHLQVVGRRAPASLYDHGLATYEEGDAFDHSAAAGFIHIFSLPTRTWAAGRASGAPVR